MSDTKTEKKKNWFTRHPILSVIILLACIPILSGVINASKETNNQAPATNKEAASSVQASAVAPEQNVVPPVDLTLPNITQDVVGYPIFNINIKNKSKKTIDAIEIIAHFTNNFNETIGEYGMASQSLFKGSAQEKIAPNSDFSASWSISGYNGATKVKDYSVYRVHYTDGTSITQ